MFRFADTIALLGCSILVHGRCSHTISLVCPVAFRADQVRAAFIRCFASLFYTYRRFMAPATADGKKAGMKYQFNMDAFLKSVPHGDSEYMAMLRQTQSFNEFIHERERDSTLPPDSSSHSSSAASNGYHKPSSSTIATSDDPAIKLFDEVILSKRNRGRTNIFKKSHQTDFLSDKSDHIWHTATATPPQASRFPTITTSNLAGSGANGGTYSNGDLATSSSTTARTPAKLDTTLMKEPRSLQGTPRTQARTNRKPVPSMLGLSAQSVTNS
jgi:hypothetical protein